MTISLISSVHDYSTNSKLDLNSTAISIKTQAGRLHGYYISNNNAASAIYVKLYDSSAAPNPATDTPKLRIRIPPKSAANLEILGGIPFSNGIHARAVTGAGDTDTTSPSTNDVIANIFYL
jgi:hypothetical protein